MRFKVTVVGAGNVGATTAQRIYERGYADVVLVDVVEDMAAGEGARFAGIGSGFGYGCADRWSERLWAYGGFGCGCYHGWYCASGLGMSRDDLLLTNMRIVRSVTEQVGGVLAGLHYCGGVESA